MEPDAGQPDSPDDIDDRGGLSLLLDGVIEALRAVEGSRQGLPENHFTVRTSITTRPVHSRGDEPSGEADETSEEYRIDTRYDEAAEEVVMVADLPGVAESDLSVGLDRERNEVRLGIDGTPLERVELPWPVGDVESSLNHGVLELRIQREVNDP